MTTGSPDVWTISHARQKARELQRLIDEGRDPRVVKAVHAQAEAAVHAKRKHETATVVAASLVYLDERKEHWGDRHLANHIALVKEGSKTAARGTNGRGVTNAVPTYLLLRMRFSELPSSVVEPWAAKEANTRKTYGRLAWRCLKAFSSWYSEHQDYQSLVEISPPKTM